MNILSIYKKYPITQSLKEHHLRVASVGAYICDHWKIAEEINKDNVVKTLLLHDIGNIIKFNFADLNFFTEEEIKNINYWKEQQLLYFNKYGEEYEMTTRIAKELNVSKDIIYLLNHAKLSELLKISRSDDWNLKIVIYSDMRVAPFNVSSINERFDDVNNRYKNTNHPLSNIENNEKKRFLCLQIEKQLQGKVDIDLNSITDEIIKPYISKISSYSTP